MKINRFIKYTSFIIGALATFVHCKKTSIQHNQTVLQTPVETSIHKSAWLNKNTGFFCGGEKSESGYIYKTIDAGQSWTKVHTETQNSLYDIYFVNDSIGYCCGEDMLILRTNNSGITWFSTGNKINSDGSYYGTLRGIYGNEKILLFAGGTNFNIGIINWIRDGLVQTSWSGFKGLTNEMRCGMVLGQNKFYSFGYGAACKTMDSKNFESTLINGDFFIACSHVNANTGFVCSYNGAVYKIDSSGNFKNLFQHNRFFKKHINFNGIAFVSESMGWVIGNNGVAYETYDGKNFRSINLQIEENLMSAVLNKNNELVISTSKGKLIKMSI